MGLAKKILLKLFRFFVAIDFYLGIALILTVFTKTLNKKKKYRVLSLIKPVFSNDLDEIKKVNSNLEFLSFPRLLLSEVVKKYAIDFSKLNDASYHPILDGTIEQENIYKAVKKIFIYLKWFLNFDAIFSGNYVYVSQQELFKVAIEENIPVIVLYKEGMFPDIISEKKAEELYSGKKFVGNRMLVYNTIIKKILLDANISGITANNTTVVGIPRLDSYLKDLSIKEKSKTITLFAFEPSVKASIALENDVDLHLFIKRCEQFQIDLFEFCKINSEYTLYIKVKTSTDAIADIKNILGISSFEDVPKNVIITSKESPKKLMQMSEIVTGFFSTTLLEAMLLNKYIITPNFDDLFKGVVIDYFSGHRNVVNYANSLGEIEDLILNENKLIKAKPKEREQVLSKMFYSLDGKSSSRVINMITEEIEKKR